MIPEYPKVYAFGTHRDVATILDGEVTVEEKVDGSQFSFMKTDVGTIVFRSRSVQIHSAEAAGGNFRSAIAAIQERAEAILPGVVYRGEVLAKPHHNNIAYERVPKGHIVLWSMEDSEGRLPRSALETHAAAMDLEVVPLVATGKFSSLEELVKLIPAASFLGGPCEGVVIKRENMSAKVISQAYREINGGKAPKDRTGHDFVRHLANKYCPPARLAKAVFWLRDAGKHTGTTKDIGPLIQRLRADVQEECKQLIMEELYQQFEKELHREMFHGVADWYKAELARGIPMWEFHFDQDRLDEIRRRNEIGDMTPAEVPEDDEAPLL